MHFNDGCGDCSDSIADGHGGVCISSGIQNNTIKFKTDKLNCIDQFTFHITLIIGEFYSGIFFSEQIKKIFAKAVGKPRDRIRANVPTMTRLRLSPGPVTTRSTGRRTRDVPPFEQAS